MRLLRLLLRPARGIAALLLLAVFGVGGAADARHHLSERGCAVDRAGRDGSCVCAGLHAAPFASETVTQVLPVECERTFAVVAPPLAPATRFAHAAVPRAPPRG